MAEIDHKAPQLSEIINMADSKEYVHPIDSIYTMTGFHPDENITRLPAIKACLFDMDGLLIDSEDKYTTCINTILAAHNRPPMPWSIKAQLQGRPGPSAANILHSWAELPISREAYYTALVEQQATVFPTCQPLPGAIKLLSDLRSPQFNYNTEIALATSSYTRQFGLKTSHLPELIGFFEAESRVLGDDTRIPKGRGKPAPDIWLVALETINARRRRNDLEEIKPEECLVFEDSVAGVESGRRAGCQVVWCPHEGLLAEYEGREEQVLAGLMGYYDEEHGEEKAPAPGKVGDGWARMVRSLEDFPYGDYKIGGQS